MKKVVIHVRLTEPEKEVAEALAKDAGLSLSEYVRQSCTRLPLPPPTVVRELPPKERVAVAKRAVAHVLTKEPLVLKEPFETGEWCETHHPLIIKCDRCPYRSAAHPEGANRKPKQG